MFQRLAGSLSFAHLAGLSRAAKKSADEDADKPGCDDDADEEAAAAETADAGEDGKKGKSGKKAKGKAEDASHDENDGDPSDEDEDNENDPGEDKMKKARKEGRKAERARIGAILASPAAAKNLQLACRLAINSGMKAEAVIAILDATPAASSGRLSERMDIARPAKVSPGTDQGGDGDKMAAIASSWDRATKPYVKTR